MTHVVTEQCIRCKYMDFVKPFPVDCFYEGSELLAINPDECIDCAVCVTECPVGAIYQDKDLPRDQTIFITINQTLSQRWPQATSDSVPLPDRERWKGIANKIAHLKAD